MLASFCICRSQPASSLLLSQFVIKAGWGLGMRLEVSCVVVVFTRMTCVSYFRWLQWSTVTGWVLCISFLKLSASFFPPSSVDLTPPVTSSQLSAERLPSSMILWCLSRWYQHAPLCLITQTPYWVCCTTLCIHVPLSKESSSKLQCTLNTTNNNFVSLFIVVINHDKF